jgi:hypothetical protein
MFGCHVNGAYVYLVDLGAGVLKLPATGGAAIRLADPMTYGGGSAAWYGNTGRGIAVDATTVYWTADLVGTQGGIYKLTPK